MSPEPVQHGSCVNKCHIMRGSGMDTWEERELSVYHRHILAHLSTHGGAMSTVQLARVIANSRAGGVASGMVGREGTQPGVFSTDELQEVYLELARTHLPVLDRKNVINYCDQSGEILLASSQH